MMERDFIAQKTKELRIKKYVEERLSRVELSGIKLKKIPLGEKIVITTSRPSLVVGSKGVNIRDLTKELKKEFSLENPQIEIVEVRDPFLDPRVVADRIVSLLERYGSQRFKSIGHKMMENVMRAGALGVEITISGKIPGARAKSWRFYQGYLKKCGDVAVEGVLGVNKSAKLKSGVIGVKVKIMPPETHLPDAITKRKGEAASSTPVPEAPVEQQEERILKEEPLPGVEKPVKKSAKKGGTTGEKKLSPRKRTTKKKVEAVEEQPLPSSPPPVEEKPLLP